MLTRIAKELKRKVAEKRERKGQRVRDGEQERERERAGRSGAEQSSSVLPAPGAPSHISPGIYEPRYDREIARMAE